MLRDLASVEVRTQLYGGRSARVIQFVVVWGERVLAVAVVAGVIAFAVGTSRELLGADWADSETVNRTIGSALLIGVGLELARLLATHELVAVLELMAFVLARKILTPGLAAGEMLLIVAAFVVLVGARRYLMVPASAAPDAG